MTKFSVRKRVLPLILAVLTVFISVFTPYHTVEVQAADIGITYGVVDTSYEVLQWILMMMGIGGFQAPNVGVKEDEKGRVVDEFCKEFFCDTWDQWCDQNGIDPSAFKDVFIEVLNQDYDAAKYVAGDIKSSVLDTIYSYLYDSTILNKVDLSYKISGNVGDSVVGGMSGTFTDASGIHALAGASGDFVITQADEPVYMIGYMCDTGSNYLVGIELYSLAPFHFGSNSDSTYKNNSYSSAINGVYAAFWGYSTYISKNCKSIDIDWKCPHFYLDSSSYDDVHSVYKWIYKYLGGTVVNPNIDVPNISDKDYAFDLVGYPWAWDTDQPDVKPWDGVDSLPIPGDIAIGDSFPGVVDLPGIETGVIDGSIPWPDVIQMIKDIDTTPDPEPDPDPDKPDEDIELPAILPDGVSDKLNELKKKFPFCIPFDLVNCVKSVGSSNATPPKFTLEVPIPTTDKTYTFTVDLEMFSPYIDVFKAGIFAIFLIGLMLSTRKLIAWQID